MKIFKPSSKKNNAVTASSALDEYGLREQRVHDDLVNNITYYWSPEPDELQEYTNALVNNLPQDELEKVFRYAARYFDSESLWNITMSCVPKEAGGDTSFSEYVRDLYGM